MKQAVLVAALTLAACGDQNGAQDLDSVDLAAADLATIDLSLADLSKRDLLAVTTPTDLSSANDLGATPDLSATPDMATAPDMTMPLDFAHDPQITGCTTTNNVPDELRCTGLYSDWTTRTIAGDATAFTPGFQLWSDGAQKSRWLHLPASTKIDVSDMNNWDFPVGTKLWKEFRLNIGGTETIVETRLLWRVDDTGTQTTDWVHTTYQWSADQTSTARVTGGVFPVAGTASATAISGSSTAPYAGYEIPAESLCVECHQGSKGFVLGMSAVLMAAPEALGMTYATLQASNLFTASNGNASVPTAALQIPGGTTERNALGHFQANCGVCCHNSHIASETGGQRLRIDYDDVAMTTPTTVLATDTAMSTINHAVDDASPYPGGTTYYRVRPTDTSRSGVYIRDGLRGGYQMPPFCTHANTDAMEAITADWIAYMTPANGYPAPAP